MTPPLVLNVTKNTLRVKVHIGPFYVNENGEMKASRIGARYYKKKNKNNILV